MKFDVFFSLFVEITVTKVGKDKSNDFLSMRLSRTLESGKSYLISLEFNGDISNDAKGFYRRSFKAADGRTRFEILFRQSMGNNAPFTTLILLLIFAVFSPALAEQAP